MHVVRDYVAAEGGVRGPHHLPTSLAYRAWGTTLIAIRHEHRTRFALRRDSLCKMMVWQKEPVRHPGRDHRAGDNRCDQK